MNDGELMRLLRDHADATVATALHKAERRAPKQIPARVVSYDVVSGVTTVVVDGTDQNADAIECENLTQSVLFADDRVMITFHPPHGAFVSHRFGVTAGLVPWIRCEGGSTVASTTNVLTNLNPGAATDGTIDLFTLYTGIIPAISGVYLCSGVMLAAPNATGHRLIELVKNDGAADEVRIIGSMVLTNTDAAVSTDIVAPSVPIGFDASNGDYLSMVGRQKSGGTLNISAGLMTMVWIAPYATTT